MALSRFLWFRLVGGFIVSILGLLVIFGWHFHNTVLIQILPSFVPMQFNTALCFLMSGIGVLALDRFRWLSLLMGFAVAILSLLTLIQTIFGVSLGVDELFFKHYVDTLSSYPGRMAPNTALCFLLTGLTLFLNFFFSTKATFSICRLSLVLLIGLLGCVAVIGYCLGFDVAYAWGSLTAMALHTALGFILISLALLPSSWAAHFKFYRSKNYGFCLFVGVFCIAAFVLAWQGLVKYQDLVIKNLVGAKVSLLEDSFQSVLKERFEAVERIFARNQNGTQLGFWQDDSMSYLKHMKPLLVLSLKGLPEGSLRYLPGVKAANAKKWLLDCQSSFQNQLTTSIGPYRYVVNPQLFCLENAKGNMMAIFSTPKLFSSFFKNVEHSDFGIIAYQNQKLLYKHLNSESLFYRKQWQSEKAFHFLGQSWEMSVWPSADFVRESSSGFPLLFLLFGLLLSALLVILIRVVRSVNWKKELIRLQLAHLERQTKAISQVTAQKSRLLGEVTRQAEELKHMAYHDALTNMPNRMLFEQVAQNVLNTVKEEGGYAAILFVDIDNFKLVNDSLGHDFGDQLLQIISERFKSTLGESDLIARFGGDEFVMVIGAMRRSSDAGHVAKNLLTALIEPFEIEGQIIRVTASIGLAVYPNSGETLSELIRNADAAMYLAKGSGKNTFRYFSDELNQQSLRALQLENALKGAIVNDELYLNFQPIIDLETSDLYGMEVLVRWKNPELGQIPPDEMIPLAEQTGQIQAISNWIFDQALEQYSEWCKVFETPFKISINLSSAELTSPDCLKSIVSSLVKHGVDPNFVVLEITETALIKDFSVAKKVLEELADMGCHLFLDDFGTGYSSLSMIREFPIAGLKIDKSFVGDIETNQADSELVETVILLANRLKLQVVAEGIETERQLASLSAFKGVKGQGYILSRPLSAAGIVDLLSSLKQGGFSVVWPRK